MAYSARCTGTYIGQFTMYNPVEMNKLLNAGCTIPEATQRLKTGDIVFGSAFYPFFAYTVDGVEYVRASYRLHEHFGRSIGNANMWMTGTRCTVCYDPEPRGRGCGGQERKGGGAGRCDRFAEEVHDAVDMGSRRHLCGNRNPAVHPAGGILPAGMRKEFRIQKSEFGIEVTRLRR